MIVPVGPHVRICCAPMVEQSVKMPSKNAMENSPISLES